MTEILASNDEGILAVPGAITDEHMRYIEKYNFDDWGDGKTSEQAVFLFPNGYGASVVRGDYTYGGSEGRYELAVIQWEREPEWENPDWWLVYDTPITEDVLGWLFPEDVGKLLDDIAELPARLEE